MIFEWDSVKNNENIKKHGVSFEAAQEIFDGPTMTRQDKTLEYGEERFTSIGLIEGFMMILVAHTDREGITRIISARKALPRERRLFHEYLSKGSQSY